MKRVISMSFAAASVMALHACENLTADQRTVVGVAGGAAVGLITANALDADDDELARTG